MSPSRSRARRSASARSLRKHATAGADGPLVPGLSSGFIRFLIRQYFLGFPSELEEAARVNGLGHRGAYRRLVVRNPLTFFAAVATITFISG